ncbi:hypothetical protein FRX31_035278, partial [Thalictrum thalictroides]
MLISLLPARYMQRRAIMIRLTVTLTGIAGRIVVLQEEDNGASLLLMVELGIGPSVSLTTNV